MQSEYSLWWRGSETGLLQLLEEFGIGFVPFFPLGAGFLTGQITADTKFTASDFRASVPRFSADALKINLALVEVVKRVAAARQATPAQIALACLLAKSPWIVPIPGTTKIGRLEENLGAIEEDLNDADLAMLDEASASLPLEGERLPATALEMVGR